jgi:hypothetical protein
VTQVVPPPNQRTHPLVDEYQRALMVQGVPGTDSGSYPSQEAYYAKRVIEEALGFCDRDPGGTCLLKALATRSLNLPGLTVRFGSTQRQPKPYVELTLLDAQGRFRH